MLRRVALFSFAELEEPRVGEVPWNMNEQGELLRLLGRFDETIVVLKAVAPDGHSEVRAAKIEKLARTGDKQVRMLSTPTW